ncbi:MAG: NAD(P)/FAD-dependent oxidoreductase [Thermaerobacter sp.]|nr:NAD(P)/FAD-dependent oxidoreductase [Thermaerobacter sp.]
MADAFDVVVVGGGHNALVSAAYLQSAGLSVVVLERCATLGGDAATEELTLPGFRHDVAASAHTVFQQNPLVREDELGLLSYGLRYQRPDPVFVLPFEDGQSIVMHRDAERTAQEIGRYDAADGAAYLRLLSDWRALAPLQGAERGRPPMDPEEFARHWRSGPLGDEGLRIRMASGIEIIRERFSHPRVRAFMAWASTLTFEAIDEAGTGLLPFALTAGRQQHSWTTPEGGSGALIDALAALIASRGGRIETNADVTRILLENGRAVGVETRDGRRLLARRAVVSGQHITEIPGSLPEGSVDEESMQYVRRWRAGLTMFVAHYALEKAPSYRILGGETSAVAMGRLSSETSLLRQLGAFRVGETTQRDPFLLAINSSLVDPQRAPEGRHTLKLISIQPYDLAQGPLHWDSVKESVAQAMLDAYLPFTTNLSRGDVLAAALESPLDLERRNKNNFRGSGHGGASDFGQYGYYRPAPRWNAYRTPVPALYLTGSTTHPGGSVSGYPGRNAALAVLQDLGIPLADVIARARAQ